VIKPAHDTHFARKSITRHPMLLMCGKQYLQSHVATKVGVSSGKDNAHPATPDHSLQFVR
jgi:hypothetical protein